MLYFNYFLHFLTAFVVYEKNTEYKKSRGFGFVVYSNPQECDDAIKGANEMVSLIFWVFMLWQYNSDK